MASRLCSALLDRIVHRLEQFLAHTTDWIWKD
jgi:hypothetical protein